MEFIVPSLCIIAMTGLTEFAAIEYKLSQLLVLEEDLFIVEFHKQVHKEREKSWHDRHIKNKKFHIEDLVILYDSKFLHHPRNFRTHLMGPYMIRYVIEAGDV
jgi:hypothetical protein